MNNEPVAPLTNAGVYFPPPFYYFGGLVGGWLLDRYVVALRLPGVHATAVTFLAGLLVGIGVGLALWGITTFKRARTAIIPHRGASHLVIVGPYRFTRNPMYTGMTIAYLGATGLIGSAWPLLLLPIVIATILVRVIRREERYLADAFGAEYAAYCREVRRWL
ncbi:MAG: isoprenylcysteine carboxylmethyltransferase family protein [bacterium]